MQISVDESLGTSENIQEPQRFFRNIWESFCHGRADLLVTMRMIMILTKVLLKMVRQVNDEDEDPPENDPGGEESKPGCHPTVKGISYKASVITLTQQA